MLKCMMLHHTAGIVHHYINNILSHRELLSLLPLLGRLHRIERVITVLFLSLKLELNRYFGNNFCAVEDLRYGLRLDLCLNERVELGLHLVVRVDVGALHAEHALLVAQLDSRESVHSYN